MGCRIKFANVNYYQRGRKILDKNIRLRRSLKNGESVDTNRTKEGKANNRRIEIVIVPDMSLMPGFEELRELSQSGPPEPVLAPPMDE